MQSNGPKDLTGASRSPRFWGHEGEKNVGRRRLVVRMRLTAHLSGRHFEVRRRTPGTLVPLLRQQFVGASSTVNLGWDAFALGFGIPVGVRLVRQCPAVGRHGLSLF